MPGKTEISWATDTWNIAWGCDKVSPGCAHCYIESTPPFRQRGMRFEKGRIPLVLHPDRIEVPLRWTRPRMIFVNSLSDLFHEDMPIDLLAHTYAVMALAPQHIYQVLTKRPERMQAILTDVRFWARVADHISKYGYAVMLENEQPVLPHVWHGVTIENRAWIGRADILRNTPSAVRFISAEPLLGPLVATGGEMDEHVPDYDGYGGPAVMFRSSWPDGKDTGDVPELYFEGIDWVIVGGESGPKARPFNEQWARDIMEDARCCGTAIHIKQMGTVWAREHGVKGKADRPGEWPTDLRVREYPASTPTLGQQSLL